jgi:exodeoxyribonuclease V alpha subunit
MEELCTVEGSVQSIIFQNAENGYTVLRLVTEEGEVLTVVGCIPLRRAGRAAGRGGRVGNPSPARRAAAGGGAGAPSAGGRRRSISYLSSGICKGVGPATAQRIVERFGTSHHGDFGGAPEKLTCLKGMTDKKAQEIAAGFRQPSACGG